MALNFPSSPALNQTHTVGTKTWKWNGYAWDVQLQAAADSASVIAAFATANTALSIANSAFAQANTGGGGGAATDSLNIVFSNHNATAYKVVAINADSETILASTLDLTQANKVVGVLDANNETVTLGTLTNPSWTWTPDQTLYLGSNGEIVTSSTIDSAQFSLKIGYALSATKVFVKIGTPVVL
jgi:hypothetical protein